MHLDRPAAIAVLLPLAACFDAAPGAVGRKAVNLAWAQAAGMRTPGGVVVPAAAFRGALDKAGVALRVRYLEEAILALDPAHGVAIAAEASAALTLAVLRPLALPIARAIVAALGEAPLACRSSAAMEDGAGAAFPGLYLSLLGVCGVDALADAIIRCWQSALSPGLVQYIHRRCPWPVDLGLALLVQPMVDAEWFGLGFTADPMQSHRGCVVELSRAGPSALVDGAAAERRLWNDGGGWQGGEVPTGLDAILAWSQRLAARQGAPVDIEFALLASGVPVLLQCRPLTGLDAGVAAPVPPGALLGLPGAPGLVTGIVGLDVALVDRLDAHQIDVILASKAILVRAAGSPLGHSAILCRELGVAMVTGIATETALAGCIVAVDGAAGSVKVLATGTSRVPLVTD